MPRPLADSEVIFGLHDPGGESIMADRGKHGWIVFTVPVGADPNDNSSYDYSYWHDQNYGLIVRLNNGYEPAGTLPYESQYEAFAQRCRNFAAGSRGVHIWVIGNEPNHANERPGIEFDRSVSPPRIVNPGEVITPARYARAYPLCRAAMRALPGHENDQVLATGSAPWNTQTHYPGNESGDWIRYFADLLRLLRGSEDCDGFALHTYTHGADPELVYSDELVPNSSFSQYHWHFRAYQDYLAVIPPNMRHLPIYITETNQGDGAWVDANSTWVQRAYGEIDWWNRDPSHQPIRALCLYRWQHEDRWVIEGKGGVIDDFRAAMQYDYKWHIIPPVPSHQAEWLSHETPTTLPAGSRVSVSLHLRNTGFNHWPATGGQPVHIGYHWFTPSGESVAMTPDQDIRTQLPHEVLSGDTFSVEAQVASPDVLGDYILRWDLVEEGVTWFADRNSETVSVNVVVTGPAEFTHPETGISIAGPFLRFYQEHGEELTGPPLAPQQVDSATGFQTQYFQNLVLEEHEPDTLHMKAAGEAMYTWAERIAQLEAEVERLRRLTNVDLQPPPMQDVTHTLPRDPDGFFQRAQVELKWLVIGHTATPSDITVDRMAEAHRQQGWPGIAYHFFVDGDGNILQTQPMAEAIQSEQPWLYQGINIGVAGDFDETTPTEAQLTGLARLCAWLLQQTGLTKQGIVGLGEVSHAGSSGEQWLGGERWKDTLLSRVQALLDTAPSGGAAALVARLQRELKSANADLAQAHTGLQQLRERVAELERLLGGGPPKPSIQDIIHQLPRDPTGFTQRSKESIRYVVINHTATSPDVPLQDIAEWHRRTFPGITYHYFIDAEGDIFQTEPVEDVADPHRIYLLQGVNVCVAGNFDGTIPNAAQLQSAAELSAWLLHDLVLPTSALVGVMELVSNHGSPGQQWLEGERWKDALLAQVREVLDNASPGSGEVVALRQQVEALRQQLADAESLIADLQDEIERLRSEQPGDIPRPNIQDVVDTLPKHPTLRYSTRPLEDLTHLAIHHSAAPGNLSPEVIARYHVNPDPSRNKDAWPGIGYHFYIMPDGTIYQTNRLETVSYHVYANNYYALGICLGGDFTQVAPTPAQLEGCAHLIAWLTDAQYIPLSNIKGHLEYPQATTHCPGDQWLSGQRWRDALMARVDAILRNGQN